MSGIYVKVFRIRIIDDKIHFHQCLDKRASLTMHMIHSPLLCHEVLIKISVAL